MLLNNINVELSECGRQHRALRPSNYVIIIANGDPVSSHNNVISYGQVISRLSHYIFVPRR